MRICFLFTFWLSKTSLCRIFFFFCCFLCLFGELPSSHSRRLAEGRCRQGGVWLLTINRFTLANELE
uniref:Putative secreted protein n=1 Tax=Anopheles triannulatus TaxID=58253 RepID=A0A2M4B4P2_9DIPT